MDKPALIDQFKKNSYLVLESFFSQSELDSIKEEIDREIVKLLDELCESKLISSRYTEFDSADEKLVQAESEYKGTTVILHTRFAQSLPVSIGETMFQKRELLDIVQLLLESNEISGHPEWNVRCKTARNKYFEVPWHQDSAYLSENSENFNQLTCWMNLIDITNSNLGTLQLIRKERDDRTLYPHKLQRLHSEIKDSWYLEIMETDYLNSNTNNIVTFSNLPRGSLVLFSNLTVHRSIENLSNQIRWTVDIRFLKTNDPSGFYPITKDYKPDSEKKMRLTSSTEPFIPIDYEIWSNNILMSNENNNNDSNSSLVNYSIEGPWFDRWK